MSLTALVWVGLAALLLLLSLRRAVWAFALYVLTFFAAPQLWWWGDEIPAARYALWAGAVLIGAVLFQMLRSQGTRPAEDVPEPWRFTLAHGAAITMVVNATIVHLLLADRPDISLDTYVELLKYVLLFFLLWRAVETRRDFRLVLVAMALGAAYIGYEVTFNERGDFSGSRLEGVGAPAADTSNGLANLMLTMLPLAGALFVNGNRSQKVIALVSAPLALNVLLMCNSRGSFLGLIAAGLTFLLVARGPTRKKAIKVLALGCVSLYLLLGDPKILDRFTSTFVGSEERDNSAASRLEYWQAGLRMLTDYPLGAGGGAFKFVHGGRYIQEVTGTEEDRSIHNGYLTEATDWGAQGLLFKLLFFGSALAAAYRTSTRCRLDGRTEDSLLGICIVVAGAGFLVSTTFGSFLNNEWVYWVSALGLAYARVYGVSEHVPVAVTPQSQQAVVAAIPGSGRNSRRVAQAETSVGPLM